MAIHIPDSREGKKNKCQAVRKFSRISAKSAAKCSNKTKCSFNKS